VRVVKRFAKLLPTLALAAALTACGSAGPRRAPVAGCDPVYRPLAFICDGGGGRDRSPCRPCGQDLAALAMNTDAGMRIPFVMIASLAVIWPWLSTASFAQQSTAPGAANPLPQAEASPNDIEGGKMFATTCGFCHQDGGRHAGSRRSRPPRRAVRTHPEIGARASLEPAIRSGGDVMPVTCVGAAIVKQT